MHAPIYRVALELPQLLCEQIHGLLLNSIVLYIFRKPVELIGPHIKPGACFIAKVYLAGIAVVSKEQRLQPIWHRAVFYQVPTSDSWVPARFSSHGIGISSLQQFFHFIDTAVYLLQLVIWKTAIR